jgi:hypothetical protein
MDRYFVRNGLIVDDQGTKAWYLNGKLHREDGPAIEDADGNKVWCLHGQLHREDGPAIENINGTNLWYLNDKSLEVNSNEEFLRIMKLKGFWQ